MNIAIGVRIGELDISEFIVVILSVIGIAGVAWYFLLSEGRTIVAKSDDSGTQRARIVIRGSYDPALIQVISAKPVELEFYRDETDSCSDTVVFSDLGIVKPLPAYQSTRINLGILKAGRYPFHCSMNMIRGELLVRDE